MRLLLLSFLVFISFINLAQPFFPDANHVFRNDVIPRIDINIAPDSLDWIYENTQSDHEFKALFIFSAAGTIDTIENIGFRLRGNTSRSSGKKSFKVSFNTFEKGREFYGLQKMNLNGEHNDPSIIRSYLSWNICNNLQLVGSRVNYINLYINNNFYGLYMNVEHIDDEFVDKRFGHESGNLYKCVYPADLQYIDNNKESYKNAGYELKTNTEADDFSDLIHFTKVLSDASYESLTDDLETIFNINGFLRYLALEMFTGHWDAYSVNKNNFYLYNNQFTGKIEFIPYDMDNTFGIDWFGVDWGLRDMYNWWSDWEDRPLTEKILENTTYRDRYSFFVSELVANYANTTNIFSIIDNVKTKIDESAENDPFRPLDYGWSYSDFTKSYTEALESHHVTYGLKPYIIARLNSIAEQIVVNDIAPIIENIYHNFPALNQVIKIKANITDDEVGTTAKVYWAMNEDSFQSVEMLVQSGNEYLTTIPGVSEKGTFKYYIVATDAKDMTSHDPANGNYEIYFGKSNSPLQINEFMASNSALIYDNYGQSEDWIEIYNSGNEDIFLGDKYLTDDFTDRTKWKMPSITLAPKSYYVIWADNDTKQGANHTNFKLSRSGDSIGIFEGLNYNYAPIDTLTYTEQETNVSNGRVADNSFESQSIITPGGENENIGVAYATFYYNMKQQIHLGNFNVLNDYIDIPGSFNGWKTEILNHDNNEDGIVHTTYFGFSANENIEYKARINSDWGKSESVGSGNNGNRQYTLIAGHNIIEHWFNDVKLSNTTNNISFKVYPNPFVDYIKIENTSSIKQVVITTLLGQIIESYSVNGTPSITINTVNYKSGVYILFLKDEHNNSKALKLLKQ